MLCPIDSPENITEVCINNNFPLSYNCPLIDTTVCCPETGECIAESCACTVGTGGISGYCEMYYISCPSLCPAEEPESFSNCTLEGLSCSFEPDESAKVCFETYKTDIECSCDVDGFWLCSYSLETYTDPSCGSIGQLCPDEKANEGEACTIPSEASCIYESDVFCCPETGECTQSEYYCVGGVWALVSSSLEGNCPSLCPTDTLDFEQECLAQSFDYRCDYPVEDEGACCPETGQCAFEARCDCNYYFGLSNCRDMVQAFCPSQILCPEEPPQSGDMCEESEYFFGRCNYYTPENPECFEEVNQYQCECNLGIWVCNDIQGTFVDGTCDATPTVVFFPSVVVAPSFYNPTMPVVAPADAPASAPTLTVECDDDKFAKFFVEATGKEEPCVWLAARMDTFSSLCDEGDSTGARSICPETCGACNDDCEDTDGYFNYNGVERPCLWLSLRNWIITEPGVCDGEAGTVCPETCDTCDTFM